MGAGSPEGVEADKPQEMLWKDWEMARIDLVGGGRGKPGKRAEAGIIDLKSSGQVLNKAWGNRLVHAVVTATGRLPSLCRAGGCVW